MMWLGSTSPLHTFFTGVLQAQYLVLFSSSSILDLLVKSWQLNIWKLILAKLSCCLSQMIHDSPPLRLMISLDNFSLPGQNTTLVAVRNLVVIPDNSSFPLTLLTLHSYVDFFFVISEKIVQLAPHRPVRCLFSLLLFRLDSPGRSASQMPTADDSECIPTGFQVAAQMKFNTDAHLQGQKQTSYYLDPSTFHTPHCTKLLPIFRNCLTGHTISQGKRMTCISTLGTLTRCLYSWVTWSLQMMFN